MSRCDTCYWAEVCAEGCRGYRYAEAEEDQQESDDNNESEMKENDNQWESSLLL